MAAVSGGQIPTPLSELEHAFESQVEQPASQGRTSVFPTPASAAFKKRLLNPSAARTPRRIYSWNPDVSDCKKTAL